MNGYKMKSIIVIYFALLTFSLCLNVGKRKGSRSGQRLYYGRYSNQNESDITEKKKKIRVSLGVAMPLSMFKKRDYTKKIISSAMNLLDMKFVKTYELSPFLEMIEPTPSPTQVLNKICRQFLANKTAVVLYLTNSENYGQDTVASQYFIHLARYVGLPLISWNADNSGFEQSTGSDSLRLQLAPTIKHQASAIITLLERYEWYKILIVTGKIAGHRNFKQVMRELIIETPENQRHIIILDMLTLTNASDIALAARTDARVFVLYSTRREAIGIMKAAKNAGLTKKSFVWITTQSVIGENLREPPNEFPIGMLGVHFSTTVNTMIEQIGTGMSIVGHSLDKIVNSTTLDHSFKKQLVQSGPSCEKWSQGEHLYQYLRNVSIPQKGGSPSLEFLSDGSKESVELKIVNLQTHLAGKRWEEIGVWQSVDREDKKKKKAFLKNVFLRVSFLEEDPYIMLGPPSTCSANKGIICQMVDDPLLEGINQTEEMRKENSTYFQCCSGFCVDLLNKFSVDLSFDFKMMRLINHETDIVMTSLKINSGREKVIDFSVPFLETGITILVAKRTGIISPTAFLEPFDIVSWMLVALVAIQIAAGFIFLFEWISPAGYNMKFKHSQGRFSFLRTLWLVWAVLFQAAVNVDCPRGYTARFMAHIWAIEEFPNLTGMDDRRLVNPTSVKPSFRFGTIPNGATDYIMKNNFPQVHSYMNKFNRSTVKEGFKAVKNDHDECDILTVGSWYAMTGYGVGFPKGSPWIPLFNHYLMIYRENGDLERMQTFWFTGACEPTKTKK
ncbi:GRIN2B [Lepeophtheirus salmonis]|uniref:GRIN2B n=1 Tax=Lepeophtheirus salmonis TaxID=72036 RepID=A0A7R8CB86_LEPSM|nr:GRIN2B [Lepeophtheirus salmonis]CAF2754275.1 GRIN2B [Lepeophtheirus salmonis]